MTDLCTDNPVVHGTCEPRFDEVKRQFERNMASGSELGAAVSIMEQGKLVVDLWSGYADKKKTLPWEYDSIVNVFSSTKGVSALCVQHAVDKGLLELEKVVTYFWPEFGQNGKRDITLQWLLNHRSGVAALRDPVEDQALFDWNYMVSRFAEERPWWEPGTAHACQTKSFLELSSYVAPLMFRKKVGYFCLIEFSKREKGCLAKH